MDDLSNKSETDSENSLTVFEVRSSDEESTLANNRFTKANEYHTIPPLITGNPLTLRADISFAGLDEYAFRNKIIESKTTKTNKTVDDEDDVCAVKTVSSVKPNVTQAIRSQADKSGQTSQKQGIVRVRPGNPKILLHDHALVEGLHKPIKLATKLIFLDYEIFHWSFVAHWKQVVLRAPRKDDVYSLDLKNIVPSGGKFDGKSDEGLLLGYIYLRKRLKYTTKDKRGSYRKDKGPTHEYILLLLQPHRTRILVKDVVQDAQEQPSENASPDKDIQDSEDVFDKEGQHQKPKDEQVWQDKLEMMATQELVANAMND
ncbi:hypothetical protein Tco_1345719 [Tanacetum coccineum]